MMIKFKTKFQSFIRLCLTTIHIDWFIGFCFVGIVLVFASCDHQKHLEHADLKSEIDSLNIEFGKDLTYDSLKLAEISRLIEVSDSVNYPQGVINLAITASRIFMSYFKNAEALEMLNLAQQNLKKADDPGLEALVNFYFGKFNFRISNSDIALDHYLKAADQSLAAGDSSLYSKSLMNIGNLYIEKGALDRGRDYLSKAIEVDQQTGNLENLSVNYHQMGVYHLKKGEMDSAKFYLDYELKMNKESNNILLYIYNLSNLASLQIENNELDKGESNSLEALRLLDSIGGLMPPTFSRSVIHANLGVLNKKRGDFEKALYYFKMANQDITFKFVPELSIKLLFDLYEIHKEMGNHALSHSYLGQYLQLRDKNDKAVADQNLLAMEMRYNFNRLQQEHEHERRRIKLVLYSTMALLGMGLFALVMFVQRQRIKIKNDQLLKNIQEIKLERLNRELASQALNMVRINERKINLIKTLKERMPSFKRENQMVVSSIIDDLEKEKNELAWKEFEMRFTEVHSDFYKKLSRINPNLTINERRLCAFLLLDMTTKEISSITGQNLRAIEQARTRLRKQLDLTNSSVSITTFLSSL